MNYLTLKEVKELNKKKLWYKICRSCKEEVNVFQYENKVKLCNDCYKEYISWKNKEIEKLWNNMSKKDKREFEIWYNTDVLGKFINEDEFIKIKDLTDFRWVSIMVFSEMVGQWLKWKEKHIIDIKI